MTRNDCTIVATVGKQYVIWRYYNNDLR